MATFRADVSEFRQLATVVRGADKTLRKEMFAAIASAAKPVKEEIPRSARQLLPKRGGLNEWVAGAQITVRQAYSGRNPGVLIKAEKPKTVKRRVRDTTIGPLRPGQTRTRTTRSRKAGTFGARSDLPAIDRGRVMHPAWGRGPLLGPQLVQRGFFTAVMEGLVARRAEKAMLEALRNLTRSVQPGGRRAA